MAEPVRIEVNLNELMADVIHEHAPKLVAMAEYAARGPRDFDIDETIAEVTATLLETYRAATRTASAEIVASMIEEGYDITLHFVDRPRTGTQ